MSLEKEKSTSEELLPFSMKYLPEYFREKAERELNEIPERRTTALEELKEMARDHNLTCDIDFVDDFLLQFLRQRKYDVPRAFKQLVNFTLYRKKHSHMFLHFEGDLFFGPRRRQFCTLLPMRCPEGCTLLLVELGKWDPGEVSFQEFQRMGTLLIIQSLRDPMTQINGFKLIYDFQDIPLKQARYCTPYNLYLLYHGLMDCFPGRYRAFHLVSESLLMKTAWTVAKTFVSKKLKERIFVSSSRRDLLDHFPPSLLPVEYGGVLEDHYATEWTREANRQQEGFTLEGQRNYY